MTGCVRRRRRRLLDHVRPASHTELVNKQHHVCESNERPRGLSKVEGSLLLFVSCFVGVLFLPVSLFVWRPEEGGLRGSKPKFTSAEERVAACWLG